MAGKGRLGVGARVLDVSRGDVVLLPPGLDHVLLEASADLDLFVAAVAPDLAERALGGHGMVHGIGHLDEVEIGPLVAEFEGLSRVLDPVIHETRLSELFHATKRRFSNVHALTRRAMDRVRLQPGVGAAALAGELRTGASAVSRIFRKDLGLRFVEYRSRIRLMSFIDYVDSGRSFTEAALEADFGSYAQCHRIFQRAFRCSPTTYFAGARHAIDRLTCVCADARSPRSSSPDHDPGVY